MTKKINIRRIWIILLVTSLSLSACSDKQELPKVSEENEAIAINLQENLSPQNNVVQDNSQHGLIREIPPEEIIVEKGIKNNIESSFSSLVIDCRGLGIRPSMSPVVLSEKEKNIYPGNIEIDTSFVINEGIVSYINEPIENSSNKRLGSNPLIIRAKKAIDFSTVVIDEGDAQKVTFFNKEHGFLNKYNVVFLLDS